MAKNKVSEYSSTASQNTDIGNININEGCAPSNINNAIRELMAQIKDFQQGADGDGLTVSTLNATTATVGSLSASSFGAITATSLNVSGGSILASASISGALTTATANITTATIGAVQGTSATLTNPLPIASGGTALTTLTAENVILGDGTNPVKFVAPSTTGNVLTSNGTTWTSAALPAAITRATAQSSTSGTSVDFTGIPSTAKRITVMLNGVSTNGSSSLIIQLGDSGGVEITGYNGYWFVNPSIRGSLSSGININGYSASTAVSYGQVTICLLDSNLWSFSSLIAEGSYGLLSQQCAGTKTLSATLDRIRLTTENGTDTFDAGSINILYE